MTTLNLNQATKLYYGNTQVTKLYKGDNLLYPQNSFSSSRYWRIDYNVILAEIQVSFDGSHTPLVLNSSNNIEFSRLPSPFSTTTTPQYQAGELNNNNITSFEYIGSSNPEHNHAYQILLNTGKTITSIWLVPQGVGGVLNPPSYLRLYTSIDGTQWSLIKEWPVSSLLLSANTLVEFIV